MKKSLKGIMKKVISLAVTAAMAISLCPTMSLAADADTYKVAWIGGSFTEGAGAGSNDARFSTLVTKWMNETEHFGSGTIVEEINAGIGGTSSAYGALRFDNDVLSKNPDMVIIEFAGNDSGNATTDYSYVIDGMEMMIRKTIANNPETKIAVLFRPDWGNNVAAKEYHRVVADYYEVPIITADADYISNDKATYCSSDNVHPNATGHAEIAKVIEQWLTDNEVNSPRYRKFPINANYSAAMPVKKDVQALVDTKKDNTGWTLEDGYYVSKSNGDKLHLKVKGSVFGVMGAGEGLGQGTYVVDPYDVTGGQGSRKTGYINSATNVRPATIRLSMGEGEHEIVINNNTPAADAEAKPLKIKDIYVDAVAYGEKSAFEALDYTVFDDNIQSMTGSNIKATPQGGTVTYTNYNYIVGNGDTRGLAIASNGKITYTLTDTEKSIGSICLKLSPQKGNYSTYKVYAVNANDEKTELNLTTAVRHTGDGNVVGQGWAVTESYITGIPADTTKLSFELQKSGEGYHVQLLDIKWITGTPVMEKVSLSLPTDLMIGGTGTAEVKGVYSNNAEIALEGATVEYYSSDSKVVAVDKNTGAITANGAGEASIIAMVTTADSKSYETSEKIRVFSNENIEKAYFEITKTNYIVGTSGKLDLVTVIDGVTEKNKFAATYTSSNEKVVTVAEDGTLTAVGAGTATITPSVPAISNSFDQITVTVYESNVVKSYLKADVDAGLLDNKIFDMTNNNANRGYKQSELIHGSKLYLFGRQAQYPAFSDNYLMHYTGGTANNALMGFVYKIEDGLESVTADVFTYNPDSVAKRVQIAYLTDPNFEISDAVYPGKTIPFTSPDITGYGAPNTFSESNGQGGYKIKSNWSADANTTITSSGNNVRYIKSNTVPAGAKYALVFINHGKLEDGTAPIAEWLHRYAGATFTYAPKLAAGEIVNGKVAITYTKDMQNPALTIIKNGATVTPTVTYDADTFTSYIDLAVAEGDSISVTAEGVSGEYKTTIADEREQIVSVKVVDDSGKTVTGDLTDGTTYVDISLEIANTTEEKLVVAAAYYQNGVLTNVVMPENLVPNADGTYSVENLRLTLGEGATNGDYVKVFCWKANLAPIDNFKGIQTVFGVEAM